MKARFTLAALLIALALGSPGLAQDPKPGETKKEKDEKAAEKKKENERTAEKDDITITVTKLGSELKNWFRFKVVVKNNHKTLKKTVSGQITLLEKKVDKEGKGGGEELGSALVYVKVPPGGEVETIVTAKEKGAWKDFKVNIQKVFEFWLD